MKKSAKNENNENVSLVVIEQYILIYISLSCARTTMTDRQLIQNAWASFRS